MNNYNEVKKIMAAHAEAHKELCNAIADIKAFKNKQRALYRLYYQAQDKVNKYIEEMKPLDPTFVEVMVGLNPDVSDIIYKQNTTQ
jgi:glycerol-3-phosphate responsive antiterminator